MQGISRRSFLRTTVFGSAALSVGARSIRAAKQVSRKPNLLVVLPDQLRADAVAGQSAGSVHAPNIHKLASESAVFERTYVTHPICAPSRSSLLCGKWPHQTGCTRNEQVLPQSFLCLPEMLCDPDYRTCYIGKWHLGDEALSQRGFQEWVSTEEYAKTAGRGPKIKRQSDYTTFLLNKGFKPRPSGGQTFGRPFVSTLPFELSKPKFLETKACDFLERYRNQPFVLFVAFYEPHPPYNGPFNNEHSLDSVALDASAADIFGDDIPLRYRLLQEKYRNQVKSEAGYRETKQKYLGLITEIDYSLGAILAKLDELGLREHTITVLTSDHGDMMGAHGLLKKMVMFEQSSRVPYLIRVPGQSPLRSSQPISHIDFAPTILELLNKPVHLQCEGKSRVSLIRGETSAPDFVFLEWAPMHPVHVRSKLASEEEVKRCLDESTRAVVSPDGWKLCLRDKDKNELYNLRDDVEERHNLYYASGHADVIAELTNQIHRWQARVGDPLKL